jgi:hypothetical protein
VANVVARGMPAHDAKAGSGSLRPGEDWGANAAARARADLHGVPVGGLVNQGDQRGRAAAVPPAAAPHARAVHLDLHSMLIPAACGSRVILSDLQRLSLRPFGLEQPEATMRQ